MVNMVEGEELAEVEFQAVVVECMVGVGLRATLLLVQEATAPLTTVCAFFCSWIRTGTGI